MLTHSLCASGFNLHSSPFSCPLINLPLSASTAAGTLRSAQWIYYATYLTSNDLNVNFDLKILTSIPSSGPIPTVDFYLSSVPTPGPLDLIFPDFDNDVLYQHPAGTEEDILLEGNGGFDDGIYIIGIHCPSSAPSTAFQLIITSQVGTGSSVFSLSLFGIVGALTVLVLCLFTAAAVLAKRRRSAIREFNESMQAVQDDLESIRQQQMMFAARGLTAGVAPAYMGASEEEIKALPEHIYQGEKPSEDARCTICLDDYIAGESKIKKMGCGHEFHSDCLVSWLQQRKHCPLCLQSVSDAHSVFGGKKAEGAVEMQPTNIRHPLSIGLGSSTPTLVEKAGDKSGAEDEAIEVVNAYEERKEAE